MIQISTALNDYRLNAVVNFLAIGTENAHVLIYGGERPAFGEEPEGDLLATIVLVEPIGEVEGRAAFHHHAHGQSPDRNQRHRDVGAHRQWRWRAGV